MPTYRKREPNEHTYMYDRCQRYYERQIEIRLSKSKIFCWGPDLLYKIAISIKIGTRQLI